MSDKKLLDVRARIADHLEEICELFTQRPKMTIIIRTPWMENGGIVLTDDDYKLAIAELERLNTQADVKVFEPDARP